MNILLTNDDGYNSEGINLLREKLSKYGEITVIAPQEAMSGKSVSIIYGRSVKVEKVDDNTFIMEGTPADCVAFGLSSLNKKFDLVVSGCNNGFNICWDVLYSGTIGACLEALMYGVPAIAFSTPWDNFSPARKGITQVMDYIVENKLISKDYVLNVNFPMSGEIKGIKMTNVHYRDLSENTYYVKQPDGTFYALRNVKDDCCEDENSDTYAVYNSYVSICKLNKIL